MMYALQKTLQSLSPVWHASPAFLPCESSGLPIDPSQVSETLQNPALLLAHNTSTAARVKSSSRRLHRRPHLTVGGPGGGAELDIAEAVIEQLGGAIWVHLQHHDLLPVRAAPARQRRIISTIHEHHSQHAIKSCTGSTPAAPSAQSIRHKVAVPPCRASVPVSKRKACTPMQPLECK